MEKVFVTVLYLPAASAGLVATSASGATANSTETAPVFPVPAMFRSFGSLGVVCPSSSRPQKHGAEHEPLAWGCGWPGVSPRWAIFAASATNSLEPLSKKLGERPFHAPR